MKVIFLDFDGVINANSCEDNFVNPLFVRQVKKVIDATGAKVVVTSNKRRNKSSCYKNYIRPLSQIGIEIYDYTPFINGKLEEIRELEMEAYLMEHPEIEQFVIIEDDYVMQRLYDHQVFIEYGNGFISKYVEPTIRILNGNLGFYPPEYDRSETFEERIGRLFPNVCLNPMSEEGKVLEEMEDKMKKFDFLELSSKKSLVKK